MSTRERGFASEKDPEERSRKASIGGKAAHQPGAHGRQWTREEAKAASAKGLATRKENREKARELAREHISTCIKETVGVSIDPSRFSKR